MKWFYIYMAFWYIVYCAEDVPDFQDHTKTQKIIRATLWPITVTQWFRLQSQKLHRMLNILWCVLISGWLISLMMDRL